MFLKYRPSRDTKKISSSRRGSALIIILIVVALLAAAGGGVYYAAQQGWIEVPYLSPKPPELKEIADYLKTIKSAEVTTDIEIKTEPLTADVKPLIKPKEAADATGNGSAEPNLGKEILTGMIGQGDLALKGKTVTVWQVGSSDQQSSLSGSLSTGGISAKFDLEMLQVNKKTFLKVGSLPIPLIDVTPLAGKWVDVSEGIGLGGGSDTIYGSPDELKKTEETAAEQQDLAEFKTALAAMWQRSLDYKVWEYRQVDSKAEVNGHPAWKITAVFDPKAFRQAVSSLITDPLPNVTPLTEEEAKDIKGWLDNPETEGTLQNLAANTQAEFLVEKKTRRPVSLTLKTIFAPGSEGGESLAQKQINASVKISYDKVNEPISLKAPEEPIDALSAMAKISGADPDEMRNEQQKTVIAELRDALKAYREKNGAYPDSLDKLIGTEVTVFPGGTVVRIPKDKLTGAAFPYRLTADGYELDFQMKIKSPAPEADDLDMLKLDLAVDGLNTATETGLSRQALSANDYDEDGLDTYREVKLQTDPTEADTDGDGYGDKQEVDGGFDPLTNAQTGEKVPVDDDSLNRPSAVNGDLKPASPASSNADQLAVSDIKMIQTALELFFADNSSYPDGSDLVLGEKGATSLVTGGFRDSGIPPAADTVTYMGMIRKAPAATGPTCAGQDKFVYTRKNATAYTITFCLEEETKVSGSQILASGKHVASEKGIDAE